MKIYTEEQLCDYLAEQLSWRKKELADLRLLIKSNRGTDRQRTYIRSGITLLYAHWEGFIKAASTAYLCFVSLRRLPYYKLSPSFVAIAMKGKLNQASSTNKATIYTEVASFFLAKLNETSYIPWDKTISTNSNLNSEVLKEITCLLGIDYKHYISKEKLIDEKLLRTRNEVAHGQYLLVGYEEYLELHSHIINLIELFRNQIENAAITKSYLRAV